MGAIPASAISGKKNKLAGGELEKAGLLANSCLRGANSIFLQIALSKVKETAHQNAKNGRSGASWAETYTRHDTSTRNKRDIARDTCTHTLTTCHERASAIVS